MAFPCADHQYFLITNAATGTADTADSLGTILTQKDKFDKYSAISYASCNLRITKKIIHRCFYLNPQLLCGAWTFLMNTSKEIFFPF